MISLLSGQHDLLYKRDEKVEQDLRSNFLSQWFRMWYTFSLDTIDFLVMFWQTYLSKTLQLLPIVTMNLGSEIKLEAVDGLEIRKAVMSIAALLEWWRLAGRHELVDGCGVVVMVVVRVVMVVVCRARSAGKAEAQLVVLLREGRGVEGVLRRGVGVVRGLWLHSWQQTGVAEVRALLSVVSRTTRALQIYKSIVI